MNSIRLNNNSINMYDWWWHSFVAMNIETKEMIPFFIEYFIINPGLWKGEIVFGDEKGKKPCYGLVKVGCWGNKKCEINYYTKVPNISNISKSMLCKLDTCELSDFHLAGTISVKKEDLEKNNNMVSDIGDVSWNLEIIKDVTFDTGYMSRFNNLLTMSWFVKGMKCRMNGTLTMNGERYIVTNENSFGYQDKNWGSDYTNPWIWLNCNNFVSTLTKKKKHASFVVGGGLPKILGIPVGERILGALYYENELIEFNFSKVWVYSTSKWNIFESDTSIIYDIQFQNKHFKVDIQFSCEKRFMLKLQYENPKGEKNHKCLWNGGHAKGTLKLFKIGSGNDQIIDELYGEFGGCEYSKY